MRRNVQMCTSAQLRNVHARLHVGPHPSALSACMCLHCNASKAIAPETQPVGPSTTRVHRDVCAAMCNCAQVRNCATCTIGCTYVRVRLRFPRAYVFIAMLARPWHQQLNQLDRIPRGCSAMCVPQRAIVQKCAVTQPARSAARMSVPVCVFRVHVSSL